MTRPKLDTTNPTPADDALDLLLAETHRKLTVFQLQRDLYSAALSLGQNDTQANTKIDELFSTFAAEWSLYILTGSPAISTAIQNDATLPWLDTLVGGVSIRQRLINNRLA